MISDQFDLWEVELQRLPWCGRSPRDLTKGARHLFLRRKPQKADRFLVDADQTDLFHAAKRGRHRYGGAPLLCRFTPDKEIR